MYSPHDFLPSQQRQSAHIILENLPSWMNSWFTYSFPQRIKTIPYAKDNLLLVLPQGPLNMWRKHMSTAKLQSVSQCKLHIWYSNLNNYNCMILYTVQKLHTSPWYTQCIQRKLQIKILIILFGRQPYSLHWALAAAQMDLAHAGHVVLMLSS